MLRGIVFWHIWPQISMLWGWWPADLINNRFKWGLNAHIVDAEQWLDFKS